MYINNFLRAGSNGRCPHRASEPEGGGDPTMPDEVGGRRRDILSGFRRHRAVEQGRSLPPPAPQASASSTLNFRVQPLEFYSGIVDLELPVHSSLFGVGLVGPDPDLRLQQCQFSDASVAEALARQATQLAFGDVQP